MISSLRGQLIENQGDFVTVDVSGVGYKVFISSDSAAALFTKHNQEVFLYVHTIVREDTLDLYGFLTDEEREFFEQIINISGIGPKSGLGIVSIAPIKQLKSAIASGDDSYLTKVSGVGKKSAKKIILELQDKLAKELEVAGFEATAHSEDNEVMDALLALGYSQTEARETIKNLGEDLVGTKDRLRAALRGLQN